MNGFFPLNFAYDKILYGLSPYFRKLVGFVNGVCFIPDFCDLFELRRAFCGSVFSGCVFIAVNISSPIGGRL